MRTLSPKILHRKKSIFICLSLLIYSSNITAKQVSPFHKYSFELKGTVDIQSQTGSQQSANGTKQDLSNLKIIAETQFGYFLNTVVEPVIDLSIISKTEKVGTYSRKQNEIKWGLGLIFNLPHLYKVYDRSAEQESRLVRKFWDKWLHYGGFVLTSSSEDSSEEGEAPTKTKNKIFQSYLVIGTRYMVYENVGFNIFAKLHIANHETEVSETTKNGGNSSIFQFDLSLLSLSVFL